MSENCLVLCIFRNSSDPDLSGRMCDDTKINDVDKNKVYAVFISYCEIYNKNIFDLLDMEKDISGKPK